MRGIGNLLRKINEHTAKRRGIGPGSTQINRRREAQNPEKKCAEITKVLTLGEDSD